MQSRTINRAAAVGLAALALSACTSLDAAQTHNNGLGPINNVGSNNLLNDTGSTSTINGYGGVAGNPGDAPQTSLTVHR